MGIWVFWITPLCHSRLSNSIKLKPICGKLVACLRKFPPIKTGLRSRVALRIRYTHSAKANFQFFERASPLRFDQKLSRQPPREILSRLQSIYSQVNLQMAYKDQAIDVATTDAWDRRCVRPSWGAATAAAGGSFKLYHKYVCVYVSFTLTSPLRDMQATTTIFILASNL